VKIIYLDRRKGKSTRALKWLMGERFRHLVVLNEQRKRSLMNAIQLDFPLVDDDEALELFSRIHTVNMARYELQGRRLVEIGFDDLDHILADLTGLHFPLGLFTLNANNDLLLDNGQEDADDARGNI
jgi:phosphoglycolate phosphatase-like HAD superfamily hydrolase